MCTNFVLIKKKSVSESANALGVSSERFLYGDFKPGSQITIVHEQADRRAANTATWWLYLKHNGNTFVPNPEFFSVNTNYAKLPKKWEYKRTRCVILATAYTESQDGQNPYLLEPEDGSTMAFGGLYKEWTNKETYETFFSASIITLKGHASLEHIHRKSTPLWLPATAYDQWLDAHLTDTRVFDMLLTPTLQTPLRATPIDKTMLKNAVGGAILISSGQ